MPFQMLVVYYLYMYVLIVCAWIMEEGIWNDLINFNVLS